MSGTDATPPRLPLTAAAGAAYALAQYEAEKLHSAYTDVEHLLLGLLKVEIFRDTRTRLSLPASEVDSVRRESKAFAAQLERGGLDCARARRLLRDLWLRSHPIRQSHQSQLTPRCADVLERAERGSANQIELGALWRATLDEPSALIDDLFDALQLDRRALTEAVRDAGVPRNSAPAAARSRARQHGRDLTALARKGELHPVVERQHEIRQVARALTQSKKCNAMLVGEAGVGKTAIVEGLAMRIAEAGEGGPLAGVQLVEISLGSLLAGARHRGDFEERLQEIVAEAESDRSLVLFIDEIHTLLGAGDRVGGTDAANLLKPALGRGSIRVIGATTADEYRRYVERDAALERRFHVIPVEEPSSAAAVAILEALRPRLEAHHEVTIQRGALEQAVALSIRYLPDRRLPDKAVDVIDQACARACLTTLSPNPATGRLSVEITADDVAHTVAEMKGLAPDRLINERGGPLATLEADLAGRILGQPEATRAVADAIRAARSGLRNESAPLGVFLFAGPTGSGKTEMAKALAECLTGDRDGLIHLDMSEYAEKHSIARLIGAPPGYIGHDEGGQLTDKVRAQPFSVVLFDEIEKAHPDVFDLFLQIFDEGRLTDGRGRSVSFRETVVVMTTNAGAAQSGERRIGFAAAGGDDVPEQAVQVHAELERLLRPEIRSRIQKAIVFKPLGPAVLEQIATLLLSDLAKRLGARNVALVAEEGVTKVVLARAASEAGARGIRRAIAELIEEPIGRALVSGSARGAAVRIAADADGLRFDWTSDAPRSRT